MWSYVKKSSFYLIFMVFICLASTVASAKTVMCEIHIYKAPCWKNYDVTINVLDALKRQTLHSVDIKKGKLKAKKIFQCETTQVLTFKALFLPPIWQNTQGKLYSTISTWRVPKVLPSNSHHWIAHLCFPGDFVGLPIPPGNVRSCKCKF